MRRISIHLLMTDGDYLVGWDGDPAELEATVRAALNELIGDDGLPRVPRVLGIEVQADDDDDDRPSLRPRTPNRDQFHLE